MYKTYENLSKVFIVFSLFLIIVVPFMYWMKNPECSQMQVIFDTWKTSAFGAAFWVLGAVIYVNN